MQGEKYLWWLRLGVVAGSVVIIAAVAGFIYSFVTVMTGRHVGLHTGHDPVPGLIGMVVSVALILLVSWEVHAQWFMLMTYRLDGCSLEISLPLLRYHKRLELNEV